MAHNRCAACASSLLRLYVFAAANYVLPQISPKSPNAAEFDKYGEIPVSMTNGTLGQH